MKIPCKKINRNIPKINYFLILIVMLMSISIVSAFQFDDVKRYDPETKELRIVNAFGFGENIVKARLETSSKMIFLPGRRMIASIVTPNKDYETLITKIDSYDYKDRGRQITRAYDYEFVDNKDGTYTIKIYTVVQEGDKVEWIPTILGFEIDEWASWIGATKYEHFENATGIGTIATPTFCYGQPIQIGKHGENVSFELGGISLKLNRTVDGGDLDFYIVNRTGDLPNITEVIAYNTTVNITTNINRGINQVINISFPAGTTLYAWENYSIVWNGSASTNVNQIQNTTAGASYLSGDRYHSNSGCHVGTWVIDGAGGFTSWFQVWGVVVFTSQLQTPENDTITLENNYNFIANYTSPSSYLPKNASYYFWWESNGTRFNQTNVSIDTSTNQTTVNLTSISIGKFKWNVYACAGSASSTKCGFASSNRTFERRIFNTTARNHSMETTEGNSETFKFNITLASGLALSAGYLVYNNTEYLGSFTNSGQEYYLTRTIITPLTNSNVNKTFYWNIIAETGDESNSTNYRQQVNALNLDNCTTYTSIVLNYTMKDEGNQTEIDELTQNSTIEIDVNIFPKGTSTTTIMNFSQAFVEDNPIGVCISSLPAGTEYRMDVTTLYYTDTREKEQHHIQNYSLKNDTVPQNITLFDLLTADSTAFEITYKDENFLPVSNALLDIQRYYVSDGLYKSIEIPKTNVDGKTVAHLVLNDITYTIIVKKDGIILATFENVRAFCEDTVTGDCQISLNEVEKDSDLGDWTSYKNLDYTLTFDENTRMITLIFSTVDGSTATISLNTTKSDRWGNDTVCSDKLASSSGTLTCLIPASYGNVTVISRIYSSQGSVIATRIFKIFPDREDYFGGNAVIMMLILILTIPLMFISDTRGVIFGAVIGFIMCGGLMIYTGFQLIGTASAIMWLIIAGGILIWKISERAKM